MPQTVDWWVRIALTLWKYIFGKPKSAKFEIWFFCYSYHEEVEKTAFDRRLQTFQGYFEDNIFYQKARGQVCDGDVDVVDKCDEGDGDGRMMR